MPAKHIDKHARDAENLLTCHETRVKSTSIPRMERAYTILSIKHIYVILALALNLVEDDIQFCDLTRFIMEGHINAKNVKQYFPENLVPHVDKLLKEIEFHSVSDKCSYNVSLKY